MTVSKSNVLAARFANRLRALRTERAWSQPDLARRSSLSAAMVSMLERGERKPSLEALELLAAAFEVDPSALVASDDGPLARSDARLLAAELVELELPRADIDALRRIARALAHAPAVAARRSA